MANVIPSIFIYQREFKDLRDFWIKDLREEKIYFAAISTSWSYNSIK